jgi:3-oxoadipate enol-lactonase
MTGVALHYTVDGPDDAPVLVLGSSLGTTGEMWAAQLGALSQRLRVVRYDHRGHGRSPAPPGPYTLADLGGDVIALMDRLGVDTFHIGGISLGGMVAMWVAAHHPHRVAKLTPACTAAQLGPAENWRTRAATVREQGMAAVAETVVGRWLPADYAAAHPDTRQWLLDMLLSSPVEGYAGCCAAIETMDLTPELSRIAAPTLVLAGGADQSTPPALAEQIAAGIPGARLEVITGAAHLANVSHPDDFNRLLLDFLAP